MPLKDKKKYRAYMAKYMKKRRSSLKDIEARLKALEKKVQG